MPILSKLKDILTSGLNREASDSLLKNVIRLYRQSGSKDKFAQVTQALGFLTELSSSVYVFINDNISGLEGEIGEVNGEKRVVDALEASDRRKPRKQLLDFEDDLDDLPLPQKVEKPKKVTFKRIKKEDARRIKGVPDLTDRGESHANHTLPKVESSVHRNEGQPQAQSEEIEPTNNGVFSVGMTDDIDNDREWYGSEEAAHAEISQYDELEKQPQGSKKRNLNRTGGGFDASGNYVDFDHDNSTTSRIPIVSHTLIPPFLKGSEHYLSLELSKTSRSIGPSVSPIKYEESELAISARNGSFIIKDRKEKRERAQQAKDSIGVSRRTENGKGQEKKPQIGSEEEPTSWDTIQKQRRALPAFSVREELMRVIAENQIVVVIGETGSGKTTQLTQFLAEEGYAKSIDKDGTRLLVACTQPRRVAAMSVAKRVAEETGTKLGEEVGYTIRFEDKTSHNKTKIKYMTEGILLRELLVDPNLESYSVVIMDEAHERTLNTDLLLGMFRKLIRRRRDLKLIVTSATMNADRFTNFFGNAPQYFIPGRTFPVEVFYSKSACTDYVDATVKQVVTIHLANKRSDGDILVFMTGQEDIEATVELIHEKLDMLENPPPLDVYPIYSSMPADLQNKIFKKQNSDRRKVVVATNIAETSLTVDGIKYVVDCGLVKVKLFNPKLGMDALQVIPVSLANAQQRSGRAGRTMAGLAYRLYTENAASSDQMYLQPIPEIQRTNLSAVMLMLKNLKVENVLEFPFLDLPPLDLLTCSLYDLWALGALDHSGRLTPLGEKLSNFPMEPTLAKLIVLSCQDDFRCSAEIATIVSMLSVPSVFYRPKERANEADSMREKFLVAELDHLTLLNVYTQWEQRGNLAGMTLARLAAWSTKNFLHHKSLLRAREIRSQLLAIMAKSKYPIHSARDDRDVRRCICAAYFQQAAKLAKMNGGGRGQAEYVNLRQLYMKMYLHPTSALAGGADISPEYVVYDELVLTKKEYMQCATAVEPEWLLQYGGIFYGVPQRMKNDLEAQLQFKIVDKMEIEQEFVETAEQSVVRTKPKPRKVMRGF